MWTAQTYLGSHIADANYFIYLLFEDYLSEQQNFQSIVVENLRQLGMRTSSKSAIFVPDTSARDYIKTELYDIFKEEIIKKIWGNTPGLFFIDKNLKDFNPNYDRWVYLSLKIYTHNSNSRQLCNFFEQMENTIRGSQDLLKEISDQKKSLIWKILKDTVMLEPNISGIGFNLRTFQSQFLIYKNI